MYYVFRGLLFPVSTVEAMVLRCFERYGWHRVLAQKIPPEYSLLSSLFRYLSHITIHTIYIFYLPHLDKVPATNSYPTPHHSNPPIPVE